MKIGNAHAQLCLVQPEQLDSLQKVQPKKVMVFIHTNWCRYCQQMQQTTFKNKAIIAAINEGYYFLDLDAESKRNIKFHNQVFKYKPTGNNVGTHQLAEHLGTVDGKVSYPTISLLNDQFEIIWQYNQFISAGDLLKILKAK